MFTISGAITDAGPVLVASGELDLTAVDEFCDVAKSFLTAGGTLTVDLAAITFLDAQGLGALISVSNAAAEAGTTLRLRRVSAHVRRLVNLTGLSELLTDERYR